MSVHADGSCAGCGAGPGQECHVACSTVKCEITNKRLRDENTTLRDRLLDVTSTIAAIPFDERRFPTRQDMRVEIARLQAELKRVEDLYSIRAEKLRYDIKNGNTIVLQPAPWAAAVVEVFEKAKVVVAGVEDFYYRNKPLELNPLSKAVEKAIEIEQQKVHG